MNLRSTGAHGDGLNDVGRLQFRTLSDDAKDHILGYFDSFGYRSLDNGARAPPPGRGHPKGRRARSAEPPIEPRYDSRENYWDKPVGSLDSVLAVQATGETVYRTSAADLPL